MVRALVRAGVAAILAMSFAACEKDLVLPDQAGNDVCGDGIVGPTEDCDVDSPGCTNCLATPGWTCHDNRCFVPCGNGIQGDGPDCTSPRKLVDCDMTGYWIARETDFTRDQVLNAVQTSSTWNVYRFSQTGDRFLVEEMIHCGIHVTGSVTVDYTKNTALGLMYANDQTPAGTHGPRRGTFRKTPNGCSFSFDRWYNVRGAVDSLLPDDFSTDPPLSALPPLPSVSDPTHPPDTPLPGANDPDHDGHPGAAYLISGIVDGTRNSAQRDHKEYATSGGDLVPLRGVQFVVQGVFDLEESILSVTKCGDACTLIASGAYVDPSLVPRITLQFLGTDLGSPRIDTIIAGPLRADQDTDSATCTNTRAALPHDPSPQ
jgi:hypothetical protein